MMNAATQRRDRSRQAPNAEGETSHVPEGVTRERCRAPFHHRRRPGHIIVLTALSLVILVAFAALAIDVGYILQVQGQLQNAADAAALAGASGLSKSPGHARQRAVALSGLNDAAGQSVQLVAGSDVEIGTWNSNTATFSKSSAEEEKNANAVRVTTRRIASRGTQLRLFLGPILGTNGADVDAIAIAMYEPALCGRIIGLDSVWIENGNVDSYNSQLGSYASQTPGQQGHVCSNGGITLEPNTSIRGNANPGQGFSVNRPSLVTGSTKARKEPIVAPPVNPGTAVHTNNNSQLPNWASHQGGIRVEGGQQLNLQPGTYYVSSLRVGGSGTINISGPTKIYVTGDVSVEGGGIANAGSPANLEIQVMGATARFAGTAAFRGVVYAPESLVQVAGQNGFYGALLGKRLHMQGNDSAIHYDEALKPLLPEATRSKLVE